MLNACFVSLGYVGALRPSEVGRFEGSLGHEGGLPKINQHSMLEFDSDYKVIYIFRLPVTNPDLIIISVNPSSYFQINIDRLRSFPFTLVRGGRCFVDWEN